MTDYRAQVRDAFPELTEIDPIQLQEQVIEAWVLGLERGGWETIEDIPYAWNIHKVTNVEHVRGVTRIAKQAATQQREFHDADVSMDTVIAAALLHDVGKCYEYVGHVEESLVDPNPTYADEAIPHSLSGFALAHEVGCPIAVTRAIPHYLGEVPERTLEAELIKSANEISSNAITNATMGIPLQEWLEAYSDTS